MRPIHWIVYIDNINTKRIETFDVFEHHGFAEDVGKAYKKHRMDFDAFAEKVRGSLFYYFCSKCEWEVIVSAWPPSERVKERKVDVYEQVMLNWDAFIEYVWARRDCILNYGAFFKGYDEVKGDAR